MATAVYIIDHHFLIQVLNMPFWYAFGFYGGFLLLLIAIKISESIESQARLSGYANEDRAAKIVAEAPQALKDQHFRARLAVMIFEYGLFISFVMGMPCGFQCN